MLCSEIAKKIAQSETFFFAWLRRRGLPTCSKPAFRDHPSPRQGRGKPVRLHSTTLRMPRARRLRRALYEEPCVSNEKCENQHQLCALLHGFVKAHEKIHRWPAVEVFLQVLLELSSAWVVTVIAMVDLRRTQACASKLFITGFAAASVFII